MKVPVYRRVFPTLIRKTFTFDAAHQLPNHNGKCANLHGHTYKADVYVQGEVRQVEEQARSDEGMILDFAYLSVAFHERVRDVLDHKFLVPTMHPAVHVSGSERAHILTAILTISYGAECVYTLPYRSVALLAVTNTTAELLAAWILTTLRDAHVDVRRVVLHETPTSCADVRFDGNSLEQIDEVDRPDM